MQPESPAPVQPQFPQNPTPVAPPPFMPTPNQPIPQQTTQPQPNPEPAGPTVGRAAGEDSDMMEPGEQIVTVVHRHPIGIIIIYLETFVAIVALIALMIIVAPNFVSNLSGGTYRLFMAGVFFAVVLVSLMLFIATYIYRQSRLLVTDRSLVQIIQKTLFNRKVSRLSMSNIEDVNAEVKGIIGTIFNYGNLNVETAGEVENFNFAYCPTPNTYADRIIEARQRYAHSLIEEGQAGRPE